MVIDYDFGNKQADILKQNSCGAWIVLLNLDYQQLIFEIAESGLVGVNRFGAACASLGRARPGQSGHSTLTVRPPVPAVSPSSSRAPCNSAMRPTIASPSPLPGWPL